MLTYADVETELRSQVPEFAPVIDEHVADNDEVLPHVLFGDLTRFVLAARESGDDTLVERCVAVLDRALREGDDHVVNLVQVSFVENLPPWSDAIPAMITAWPESLRSEVERQRDWNAT
jgi:hypothetical protein